MHYITTPDKTLPHTSKVRGSAEAVIRHSGARADFDHTPTSFGVFKPVGWLMIGLSTQAKAEALVAALKGAGWQGAEVQHFSADEVLPTLEEMISNEGLLADFGFEIVLVRRYVDLAKLGYEWLLVKADGLEHAAQAAAIARSCDAELAVHYRTLTVEELI
jgi:hypothetical protein